MTVRFALLGITLGLVTSIAAAGHASPSQHEPGSKMHALSNSMQEGGVHSAAPSELESELEAPRHPARARLQQRRFAEAEPLLRDLHGSGDVWATFALVRLYLNGLGVARDDGEALILLTSAAENGSDEAALALGSFGARKATSTAGRDEARHWLNQALISDNWRIRRDARRELSRLD
ncbi:MAG: hypothetical protein K2X31_07475 [Sphingopyxis sp.]|nr:hypothetical protein [Sphingopyxis sp.]